MSIETNVVALIAEQADLTIQIKAEMSAQYSEMTRAVTAVVKGSEQGESKWVKAGGLIAGFYGSVEACKEVSDIIKADCIIAAFTAREQADHHAAVIKKNSKAFGTLSFAEQKEQERVKDAKQAVSAKASKYYARLMTYAFPPVKAEKAAKRELDVFLAEEIAKLIAKVSKAEDAGFEAAVMLKHLKAAAALLNTD